MSISSFVETRLRPIKVNREKVVKERIQRVALMAAALAAVVPATIVPAAAFEGRYRVDGRNFDGSPYSGTAEIVGVSETTCRITWRTGSSSSEGFCMRNGDAFSAAYRLGNQVGLVIYKARPDGVLDGLWTIADRKGVGRETLTPLN